MDRESEQRMRGMGRQLRRFASRLDEYGRLLESHPGDGRRHLVALPVLQDQIRYWASSLDELRGVFDPEWHQHKPTEPPPPPPSWRGG